MHSIEVADATISIFHEGRTAEGRQAYRYTIKTPGWEYTDSDISSGVGAEPDEASMAPTLLGFLTACAESRSYGSGDGENASLFPEHVGEWAEEHSDELAIMGSDLEGQR